MAETTLEAAARSLGARIDPVFELFDHLKDVLFWIKDKKGVFRWVNTTLMLHIGRSSRDQIIGRTDFDLFEPYLANQYQMDDAQVLRGRPITSRVEMIVFHHTPRWIVTSKLPVRSGSGRIVGTAGVATMAVQEGSKIWTESRLAPAMAFISEHYHEPVSIRAMAQTCGMSVRVVSSPVPRYLPVHAPHVRAAAPRSHELPRAGLFAAPDRRGGRRMRLFRSEPFHQGVPTDHG